jgi:hypothetical protein
MNRLTILGAILFATTAATPAAGTGYYNVPSSFWQCVGCGRGGGYHAPLVLGPVSCRGWCAANQQRLPFSPSPPYGSAGCGGYGGDFAAPTVLDPAPVPSPPSPIVVPTTRTHRPLFLR